MSDTPSTDAVQSIRLRASSRDREDAATVLRAAMADGMLTVTEFDDRSSSVYSATYRDEVADLTADVDHVQHLARTKPTTSSEGRIRHSRSQISALLLVSTGYLLQHRRVAVVIGSLCLLLLMGVSALTGGWILDGHEHHAGDLHHGDE